MDYSTIRKKSRVSSESHKNKDNFSRNKEGFSSRANGQLNISWLLIELHKHHVTVASSTPAAASQERSQVELTVGAKEILIMIVFHF